jgi:integrase
LAWIERRENGWLVRWRDQGKGRSKKFPNDDDAVRFKQTIEEVRLPGTDVRIDEQGYFWAPVRSREAADRAYSVEEYAKAMVEANQDLSDTTKALYRRIIRVWIEGTDVGLADIRTITPETIERWWASLPNRPGALSNVAQLLSAVFRRAVKRDLRESNPLERTDVRKPRRADREEVAALTTEQVEALANGASTLRDRLEILLMAYGGLRAGEVGGLRLADIDWERSRVHISQQVVRVAGEGLRVTRPKTKAARRVVTLPGSVMDELREYIERRPPGGDGLVFKGVEGGKRDSVRINDSVQSAARKAGVKAHAHQLRHTAVSMWIADGASPLDVQRMVGYSDIKMTLGLYAHLFDFGGTDLAERMEKRRETHRNGPVGRSRRASPQPNG